MLQRYEAPEIMDYGLTRLSIDMRTCPIIIQRIKLAAEAEDTTLLHPVRKVSSFPVQEFRHHGRIASHFYSFFALLVHLERFSCQLKRTVSNISQAVPLHIFYQGNMFFIIIFFSFVEATSKPFDTAEKLTVTVQGL